MKWKKLDKIGRNGSNGHNWTKLDKMEQQRRNRTKLIEMDKDSKLTPQTKLDKIEQNGTKWTKWDNHGRNLAKWNQKDKIDKNGQPWTKLIKITDGKIDTQNLPDKLLRIIQLTKFNFDNNAEGSLSSSKRQNILTSIVKYATAVPKSAFERKV